MSIEWNDDALNEHFTQIGDQVREIVNTTARETANQDIAVAADILHARLNAVDGLDFAREWSVEALETLRRGDELTIEIR